MIDFAKVQNEAAFIKKALAKFGLSMNLNSAIGQLASTIRDHAHLQRLLTEAEPEQRQMLYDSVRPHLKFKAKPLDVYVSDAKQMAEREQLPVMKADGSLEMFRPSEFIVDAQSALSRAIAARTLTLVCAKCTIGQEFYGMEGETPIAVIMKARRKGWVYDPMTETESCPNCAGVLANA